MNSQALVQAQQYPDNNLSGMVGLLVSDCQSSTEHVALLFSSTYVVQHSRKPELLHLTAETCKLCNPSPVQSMAPAEILCTMKAQRHSS